MTSRLVPLTAMFCAAALLSGCGGGGDSTPASAPAAAPAAGGNTLIVSASTPASGNGSFSLPIAKETPAGGTSTAKRVEFTDATPATRTLRLYYEPSTGALTNIQYDAPSPAASFFCIYGDPIYQCPAAKITFSATGKSILLDLAKFESGSPKVTNGILEGYLTW
jgi:hypothetical protein